MGDLIVAILAVFVFSIVLFSFENKIQEWSNKTKNQSLKWRINRG